MPNLWNEFKNIVSIPEMKIGEVISVNNNTVKLKDIFNKEYVCYGNSEIGKRLITQGDNIISEAPDFQESTEWV